MFSHLEGLLLFWVSSLNRLYLSITCVNNNDNIFIYLIYIYIYIVTYILASWNHDSFIDLDVALDRSVIPVRFI